LAENPKKSRQQKILSPMANLYFEIEEKYKLKTDNETVKVEVKIGDAGGGAGAYLIFLGRTLKGANKTATMGNPSAIAGKWMIVSATIPDVLEETNWVSVTVFVHEGDSKKKYGPYPRLLPNHLDIANFFIKIENQ
jgi:hypothetical protein